MTAFSVATGMALSIGRATGYAMSGGGAIPTGFGIGSVVILDGQQYMSTLPDNQFDPHQFGWDLFGEGP
jgi:hypothetical protein